MELFGPAIAPYAAVTCAMSYLLTGHRSVIPTQLLHESKSPSFELASQQEIERVTLAIKSRRTTLTKMFSATVLVRIVRRIIPSSFPVNFVDWAASFVLPTEYRPAPGC